MPGSEQSETFVFFPQRGTRANKTNCFFFISNCRQRTDWTAVMGSYCGKRFKFSSRNKAFMFRQGNIMSYKCLIHVKCNTAKDNRAVITFCTRRTRFYSLWWLTKKCCYARRQDQQQDRPLSRIDAWILITDQFQIFHSCSLNAQAQSSGEGSKPRQRTENPVVALTHYSLRTTRLLCTGSSPHLPTPSTLLHRLNIF